MKLMDLCQRKKMRSMFYGLQSPRCKDILPSGMQNKSSGDWEDRCGKYIGRRSR